MTTSQYQVTGMTCAHCEHAVAAEVSGIPGVQAVDVNATTGVLLVTSAAPVSDDLVLAAVDEAGYQAVRTP